MRSVLLPMAVALALVAPACGGDDGGDEGDGNGRTSEVIRDAVAKTEAARTARMEFTISIGGEADERFSGDVLIDFEHDRNHMTMDVGRGRTVELFADGSEEYVRLGSSGRYQPLPRSEQSPVANNPTDSLQYVGTDVVDVTEGDETGCYEGELDFDRVFERVEEGREAEFPDTLRGKRAPVHLCVDGAGRIERYDVELSLDDVTVDTRSTLSDHGSAPSLEPLGPDERPR